MPEFSVVMRGYHRRQVDELVAQVEGTLGRGPLTGQPISLKEFGWIEFDIAVRGYDKFEVDGAMRAYRRELAAHEGVDLPADVPDPDPGLGIIFGPAEDEPPPTPRPAGPRSSPAAYAPPPAYDRPPAYDQPPAAERPSVYGPPLEYDSPAAYGRPAAYDRPSVRNPPEAYVRPGGSPAPAAYGRPAGYDRPADAFADHRAPLISEVRGEHSFPVRFRGYDRAQVHDLIARIWGTLGRARLDGLPVTREELNNPRLDVVLGGYDRPMVEETIGRYLRELLERH